MAEELKIYIQNPESIETKLREIGAKFVKGLQITDTYYDQPGMVLKVTESKEGNLLTQLEAYDGGFRFIKEEKLEDLVVTKNKLENKYGVKCILQKTKRFWDYQQYNINLNLFNDIGNFLIIEGDKVSPTFFTTTLDINNPRYLNKSFAQLKLEL